MKVQRKTADWKKQFSIENISGTLSPLRAGYVFASTEWIEICVLLCFLFYPWHRPDTPLLSPLYIFLFLNSEEPIKLGICKSTGLLFIYHHLETHSKSATAVGFKCPHLRWWKLTLIPSGTCWYKCHENQT